LALRRKKIQSAWTLVKITIGIAAIFWLVSPFAFCAWGQTLRPAAKFDLPGPAGKRFDYLTVDDQDHFLLSAHLGPGILYVIDMRSNQVVKAIPGLPGITGLEFVPETRKVYTSDWGEEKIGIVDLHSMSVLKRLPTEAKPNGSTYASAFHKMYVANTLGKAVTVVDTDKDEIVKVLKFESETGMPQYDAVARKVYVNLRNTNEVAEIDPSTDTVVGRYPVEGCQFNHGMAVDSEHHRAFILCSGNRTFTAFALDTHKAVAHLNMPAGADVVKFDPGLGRIYVACSSGSISVYQARDADHYQKLEDFPVDKMVHSLAVHLTTHRVYAPEQEERGHPVARMVVYEALSPDRSKP
jgi:DNA-binding beta-propeller fold protein YncE